ncbi:small multi-drug export protein, partial [Chloroflexota bacterium]
LNSITRVLSKISIAESILQWLFKHTRRRGKIIEKYERIGLILFVATPLPITGAWTGALAAVLLGLKFKYAFLSISVGIIIAGIIVTCATLLGWSIYGIMGT